MMTQPLNRPLQEVQVITKDIVFSSNYLLQLDANLGASLPASVHVLADAQ
jgi:hypothetical protein